MIRRYADKEIEAMMDQLNEARKAYNARQLRNMVIVILAMIIGITVGVALVKMLPGPLLKVESTTPEQTLENSP